MSEVKTTRNTRVVHSEGFTVENQASSSTVTRRSRRHGSDRRSDTATMLTDFLIDGLASDENIQIADDFDLVLKTPARLRRRSSGGAPRTRIETDVSAGENAALLLEIDGVYTWRFPSEEKKRPARRGRRATRTLIFSLEESAPSDGGARRGRRGLTDWVSDQIIDRVRAVVVKYVAGKALTTATRYLERNIKPGMIHIVDDNVQKWAVSEQAINLELAIHTPAKVLLLVHGTFSSTIGSFGALMGTASGKRFVKNMLEKYDAVLAYDHATLGEWPEENAKAIHNGLKGFGFSKDSTLDVVCFSRGGLVTRTLIEDLLINDTANLSTESVVFVGCTNGGTALADQENWKVMLDLFTNIGVAAGKGLTFLGAGPAGAIIRESVKTLSTFMQAIVDSAVTEAMVPGISAMSPAGPYVSKLNDPDRIHDQSRTSYYVIGSDFEPSFRDPGTNASLSVKLLQALADLGVDSLMKESNDLVVDNEGMQQFGVYDDRVRHKLFWDENAVIYHTNYFAQPDVALALDQWLITHRDEGAGVVVAASPIEIGGDISATDVLVAVNEIEDDDRLVVINRPPYGRYVRTAGNLRASLQDVDLSKRIGDALDLHETDIADVEIGELTELPSISATGVVRLDGDTVMEAIAPPLPHQGDRDFRPPRSRRKMGVGRSRRWPAANAPAKRAAAKAMPRPAPGAAKANRTPAAEETPFAASDYESVDSRILEGASSDDEREMSAAEPAFTECNFAAEMEGAPDLNTLATIEVTVSREEIELRAEMEGGKGSAKVRAADPIDIVITAVHNCRVVGKDQEELFVPEPGHPSIYKFQVSGIKAGRAEIRVDAKQGARRLCRIVLQPDFADHQDITASTVLNSGLTDPPSLELRILEFSESKSDPFSLLYILECKDLGIQMDRNTERFDTPKEAYLKSLYNKLEGAWGTGKNFEDLMWDLRSFGAELFEDLIPEDIRQKIWDHRDDIGSIEVISNEPSIPWELLHIKEPGKKLPIDGNKFLAEMGLIRWLSNAGWPPASLRARHGKVRHVIPDYEFEEDQLPNAPAERAMMETLFSSENVEPRSRSVAQLISEPDACDLLHFACHGSADEEKIWDAGLLMSRSIDESTGEEIINSFRPYNINQHANFNGEEGIQPIVFLNACQTGKAGRGITGTGGMAEAFIRNGAGLFIGSLWSIGDEGALSFADTFYRSLLGGKTVTEAARDARTVSKESEEPTWLAYSVHGHPYARFSFED